MTVHHAVVSELLATFEDEREIEGLPMEEIQADLRILGFDPTASIALAERLAATPRPAVVSRLAKIGQSEATGGRLAQLGSETINALHAQPSSNDCAAPTATLSDRLATDSGKRSTVAWEEGWRGRSARMVTRRFPTLLSVRRQLAIAACLPLLFVAGAAAYLSRVSPAFEAEALVMLKDRQGLQHHLFMIESRRMAEQLVDQLNLHLLPEFNPALREKSSGLAAWLDPARLVPSAVLDRLPRAWAPTLMTTTSGAEMADQQQAALLRSEIVDNVLRSFVAEPANGSTVIGLRFISTDPQLAALGANALARLYLAEQLETKQTASRRVREFLEHETERLRASVASAEQAIDDYRRQAGLGGASPDERQLSGLTTQLVLSRSERAAAEARLRQVQRLISSGTDLDAAAQMLDSPILNELRQREIELNRQRAELSIEYGERHPRMVNLRSEQATLEERKMVKIRQIAQRLNDEVQVLRSREATLEANIDGLKGQMAEYREAEIGLTALQRDADADRGLLETYINRAKEIASQQKAQEPDARIISRAVMPDEPSYPRRGLIFGVALLVGALIGLSWALLWLNGRTVETAQTQQSGIAQ